MRQIELVGKSLGQRLCWVLIAAAVISVLALPLDGFSLWPDAVHRFVMVGGWWLVILLLLEFAAWCQRCRRKR
ncbi:hypothetical protein ACN2WE_30850 [Streptomyces sp. cg28]|uniref:hypothetical protein n=1 Tax=Streptomyces sp. cg28 TaxID=3403457 RepID=UPI003B213C34